MLRRSLAVAAVLVCCAVAQAAEWPQFRGPNRDGKSPETGLLKSWAEGGPKLLWTAKGCGAGYGSPAIAGGLIAVTGDIGGKGCLTLFTLDGNKVKESIPFSKDNAKDTNGPGTRSTPTLEGGMIYVAAPFGELACFDAKKLEKKWEINIQEKYKGKVPQWEYSESPLIDGENLICTPGGPDATIAAVNKGTGQPVWTSKGLGDGAGHASCIKIEVDKLPQVVTMTASGLVGVSAKTGQFLWRYNRPSNTTANCPSPVADGERVFEATGYNNGGGAVDLKVSASGVKAEQAWETKDMVCHHGGYVLVDGFLYGNNGGGWACLDWKTGQTKYKANGVGKGCVIYADGMLYCMSESGGKVGLIAATPEGHKIVSQFSIPAGGKGPTWAHPAISDGRLYIRHDDMLFCYDIKGGAQADATKAPEAKDKESK
jgi:outer membrane protein assembly factor BamB